MKKIDRASVMIWKALTNNEVVDATFKFYRPNPFGNGTEQQYYTVHLTQARISGFHQFTPQASDPKNIGYAIWEEVEITFGRIVCTYVPTGTEHSDSMRGGAPPLSRVPPPGVLVPPALALRRVGLAAERLVR